MVYFSLVNNLYGQKVSDDGATKKTAVIILLSVLPTTSILFAPCWFIDQEEVGTILIPECLIPIEDQLGRNIFHSNYSPYILEKRFFQHSKICWSVHAL